MGFNSKETETEMYTKYKRFTSVSTWQTLREREKKMRDDRRRRREFVFNDILKQTHTHT